MSQTIADMIISQLITAGVKRIYGLIGDSLNPFGEAVRINPKLDWISVRHEEVAAFAAGAEAILSKDLCVCAGTSGPGSIHLINGLYDANRNHAPVLAIVTDTISSENGLSFFQATTPMRLYEDCSIFCERIMNPAQMPHLLQEAMQAALSNSGVAVIIISKDIAEAKAGNDSYDRPVMKTPATIIPPEDKLLELAAMIDEHHKITLYCGHGCLEAKSEVHQLAEILNAPMVSTLRSFYFIDADNSYSVGLNGMVSEFESKYALDNCDLLILLGTDFPYRRFLPQHPKIIQIDKAPKHLGRRSRLDMGIYGDIKSVLDPLLTMLKGNSDRTHFNASYAHYQKIMNHRQQDVERMAKENVLNPEYLTHILSQKAENDAIFTVDVGLNDIWAARYIKPKINRIITGSFKHGTMAAAVPYAIGIKMLYPDRQVIAMAGDGGLTMLMGDLLTIVQHNLDIKIIVYNNGELGFINREAEMEKIPPFQTWLKNPNFAALAEVIGFKGIRIESPEDVVPALERAFNHKGPVLIDALTNPLALG